MESSQNQVPRINPLFHSTENLRPPSSTPSTNNLSPLLLSLAEQNSIDGFKSIEKEPNPMPYLDSNSPSLRVLKKKISSLSQANGSNTSSGSNGSNGPSILSKSISFQEVNDSETSPGVQSVLSNHNSRETKFNSLSSQINDVLLNLNTVYSKIGYSSTEVSIKKDQIFSIIRESIENYSSEAKREKITLDGECEWLRQQIITVLGLIDDKDGTDSISLFDRGVVFNNKEMFKKGYREEEDAKRTSKLLTKQKFFENSPFNTTPTNIAFNDSHTSQENIPTYSLLQTKSRLNKIFLVVLQKFNESFLKLNKMNLLFVDLYRRLEGDYEIENKNLIDMLPSKTESDYFISLFKEFESTLQYLNLFDDDKNIFEGNFKGNLIVSSPSKISTPTFEIRSKETNPNFENISEEEVIGKLQDLNSTVIKIIKNLTFSKLSTENFNKINLEIGKLTEEFNTRIENTKDIISECLSIIRFMSIDDEQLSHLQREADRENEDPESNDGYFNQEALTIILKEPEQFGLTKLHLDHLSQFHSNLNKLRIERQTKFDESTKECKYLWERLNESDEYIESFLLENESLTENTLKNLSAELARLHERKKQYIQVFINDIRAKIEETWDKLYYTQEQKSMFTFYNIVKYDDAVLEAHEAELKRLEALYESYKPILTTITQLEVLLQEKDELEESSKDSSRLLSRNSSKILLQEEKTRRKIARYLPKLIHTSKFKLAEFQSKNDDLPLVINGEVYLDKLMALDEDFNKITTTSSRVRRSPPSKPKDVPSSISRSNSGGFHVPTRPIFGSFSAIRKPTPKQKRAGLVTQSTSRRQPLKDSSNNIEETPIRRKISAPDGSSLRVNPKSMEIGSHELSKPSTANSGVSIITSSSPPKSPKRQRSPKKGKISSPKKYQHSPLKIMSPNKSRTIIYEDHESNKRPFEKSSNRISVLKRHKRIIDEEADIEDSFNFVDNKYELWKFEKLKQLNRDF